MNSMLRYYYMNRELILYLCVTPAARINTSATPRDKRVLLMRVWYAKGSAAAILWFANFHGITVPWRSSRLGSTWVIELSRLPLTAGFIYDKSVEK